METNFSLKNVIKFISIDTNESRFTLELPIYMKKGLFQMVLVMSDEISDRDYWISGWNKYRFDVIMKKCTFHNYTPYD